MPAGYRNSLVFHEMPVSRQGHVEDEPLFFWGGMFWPWQDRTKAFDTILRRFNVISAGKWLSSVFAGMMKPRAVWIAATPSILIFPIMGLFPLPIM
jgi:hypothetical protein